MPTSSYILVCIITVGAQQSHQPTTLHYDEHLSCELCLLHWLPCLHSWDTRLLNCAQRSQTTWCRAKRGARDSAMCERAQHSPAQCPSMVNQQRRAGARSRAAVRHPERQLQGPEMENQPPSPPLIPHSQHSTSQSVHTTTPSVGEGRFGSVVSWYYAHIYCSNLS